MWRSCARRREVRRFMPSIAIFSECCTIDTAIALMPDKRLQLADEDIFARCHHGRVYSAADIPRKVSAPMFYLNCVNQGLVMCDFLCGQA